MLRTLIAISVLVIAGCSAPAAPTTSPPVEQGREVVSVPGKPLNMALPIEAGLLGSKFSTGRSGLEEYTWLFAAPLVGQFPRS
jgi:hypothetical protein